MNAGDLDALVARYEEQGTLIVAPHGRRVTGHERDPRGHREVLATPDGRV